MRVNAKIVSTHWALASGKKAMTSGLGGWLDV